MKKITQSMLVLISLSVFLLSACAPSANNEVEESEPEPEEVVVEEDDPIEELNPDVGTENEEADMENLISEKIKDNHTLAFILGKNKTREEWSDTLDRMIGYGAKISPEEKESIIEWLVSRNE